MPLNATQLAALDAFVNTLTAEAPPPIDAHWWRPTPSQTVAFAAAHGLTPLQLFGDDQTKIAAAPNFDAAEFKTRLAFGYVSSGVRRIWTVRDLQLTRDFCDRINAAPNAAALNALIENGAAEGVETDAVIAAVMGKASVIDPYSFIQPVYAVPSPDLSYFPARTLAEVAAYLLQTSPIVPPGVE
jgi:hypothetical protein